MEDVSRTLPILIGMTIVLSGIGAVALIDLGTFYAVVGGGFVLGIAAYALGRSLGLGRPLGRPPSHRAAG